SIITRSTVMLYAPAAAITGIRSPRAPAIRAFFMCWLLLKYCTGSTGKVVFPSYQPRAGSVCAVLGVGPGIEVHVAIHPGLVVAGDIAGKFQVGLGAEGPDEFLLLTRLEQHAVGVVVFHGVAI